MRVGLNLLYLLPGVVGGTETYAAGLLDGLARSDAGARFTVFVNEESADWPLPDTAAFERVVCPVRARSRVARYRWEQWSLPRLLRRTHPVDVLHSLGYVAPLAPSCPSVVTIHDLNYRAFGDRMPLARRLVLRAFVERAAHRAERVIAVSEFAKSEMVATLGLDPRRIAVTHHAPRRFAAAGAAEDSEARRRLGLRAPYMLAFSSVTPNKNIGGLLEAYGEARRAGIAHELVLVGHPPPFPIPSDAAIRTTGYVDDATLRAVLFGADAMIFPSLYEGFGLPVLEAMAAGVPVACSAVASLPEVGGDAVVYFDPRDAHSIANAIVRLARDGELRASLRERGRARARGFSWDRAAATTLDTYRAAIAARPGRQRTTAVA